MIDILLDLSTKAFVITCFAGLTAITIAGVVWLIYELFREL